jgi:hypothetical protein
VAVGNGALAPTRDFPFSPAKQRTDLSHLLDVSRQFQIHGEILHAEQCKAGHINETYTATYDQGGTQVSYIHQRINHGVFKKPADVMDNLMRVWRIPGLALGSPRSLPHTVPARREHRVAGGGDAEICGRGVKLRLVKMFRLADCRA